MGILQARILAWVAISCSRGSSQPKDRTCIFCIGRQILHCWATREAPRRKLGLQMDFIWCNIWKILGYFNQDEDIVLPHTTGTDNDVISCALCKHWKRQSSWHLISLEYWQHSDKISCQHARKSASGDNRTGRANPCYFLHHRSSPTRMRWSDSTHRKAWVFWFCVYGIYFSNIDFSTLDKVFMLLLPRSSTVVCANKKKKIEKEKSHHCFKAVSLHPFRPHLDYFAYWNLWICKCWFSYTTSFVRPFFICE